MQKLFMFEKPLGMRDTLPSLYETKKELRSELLRGIEQWGYQLIETPTLEYYDTVGSSSAIADRQLFKLLDQQGHTLVLRPDMTAPIARVAASKLLANKNPLRLAYSANVYRAQQREGGRPAEFEQVGIECIGDQTLSADAEVIALLVSLLQNIGLETFAVTVGHIGFVNELFLETVGNEERANTLRRFLYEKNFVGYKEHVKGLSLSSIDKQRLLQLLHLRGDENIIEDAMQLVDGERGKQLLLELQLVCEHLRSFGVSQFIKLDLTLLSHMSYYTGLLFEVYAEKVGFLLGNGGRYDNLLSKFHVDAPATGFGIRIDRLLEALGYCGQEPLIHSVIYSSDNLKRAIEFADERRKNGERVILQDISGLTNVDAYTKSFAQVSFFIGEQS
ncbi:ATP phosphoribosyltransferase regulatory subunit [Bacillus sp. SM2101]|uniref:ATP phosphoribosyltransferase regulatory subunit n=1 Tax=Bacillus sp. SM2101 TaxID=2805366 RepID=UPI001BDEC628|nr:ATP phosphoribosyltransferase regulatory subunit [Bacillus sp. SM2101]